MQDPEILQHPGPTGFASQATPINEKRGIPYKKIMFGLLLLGVIYFIWSALTPDSETSASNATQQSNEPTKPNRSLNLFNRGGGSDDGPGYPRLVYILGDEATFVYDGAYYRLPDGTGPIGGDWFCGMLDGRGVATIYDSNGVTYRLGVDRTYSPDLRRNSGGKAGSVSSEVRPPR